MRRIASPLPEARRPQRGFTLVELLVVITIIAVLVGLTMPAITAAREQGRQVVCRGNLQNVATAVVRYNEANGSLPGWRMNAALTGTVNRSWPAMIMTFMDRRDIGDLVSGSAALPPVYVGSLVCPSSPPDTQQSSWLSYAGASSTQFAAGVMREVAPRVSLDDVSASGGGDGQTTTLLLGEKCGALLGGTVEKWDNASGLAVTDLAFGLTGSPPAKVINGTDFTRLPSSSHSGGAMMAFCDSHVQFLKESLQPRVFGQLMSWRHSDPTIIGSPYSDWVGSYLLNEGDY